MWYCGGSVGHVGAGPNPECDDGWTDEGEDMELWLESAVGSRDDVDDEREEEKKWSEFKEEEDLGPEDGEADDEVEENYADL